MKKEFRWQNSLEKTRAPKIARELQEEDGVYVFKTELCYEKRKSWTNTPYIRQVLPRIDHNLLRMLELYVLSLNNYDIYSFVKHHAPG